MLLTITSAIRNEWLVRCIADVVPALGELPWESQDQTEVDNMTARAIRADCEFYSDPKAVDASAGERAAYRALLAQIDTALAATRIIGSRMLVHERAPGFPHAQCKVVKVRVMAVADGFAMVRRFRGVPFVVSMDRLHHIEEDGG